MLKAPLPGLVKTRLARELPGGNAEAIAIYRQLVEHQWSQLPEGWPRVVHYAPADAAKEMQQWLPEADDYIAQAEGDLGARLEAAVNRALQQGAPAVFLIGGDCPGLTAAHFREAWEQLRGGVDYVIGPASDGGYTLLALKQMLPALFRDMPWSTSEVAALTKDRAKAAGWTGAQLEMLEDVDDLASWRRQALLLSAAKSAENHA